MVRLGLGLYGVDPVTNAVMHNVSSLYTTILQIHEVPQEDTVGYSRKGVLTRPSRIAALPIGYADGLNRHLGCGRLLPGERPEGALRGQHLHGRLHDRRDGH